MVDKMPTHHAVMPNQPRSPPEKQQIPTEELHVGVEDPKKRIHLRWAQPTCNKTYPDLRIIYNTAIAHMMTE